MTRQGVHFPVPLGAICAYCPEPASGWDHVRPISWGGTDDPSNMVPACWSCNKRKKDQPAEVFSLSRADRERWLRARGWVKRSELPRDPDDHAIAIFGGRRFRVYGDAITWFDPNTGDGHIFRYAIRKAAWGSEAAPQVLHERLRWW